jgi:uncharacterized protein (DUF433 family)
VYPLVTADPRIADGAPLFKGRRITVRMVAGYCQLGMSAGEVLLRLARLNQGQAHAAFIFHFYPRKDVARDLRRNLAASKARLKIPLARPWERVLDAA